MKRSGEKRIGLWLLILFLAACNRSAPTPDTAPALHRETIIPLPSSPPAAPVGAWQVWPASPEPQRVFDVARGDHFMWAGTSSGVVRLDPATRAYTVYDQPGTVQRIFPIADDAVYAGTLHGIYYFDGQVWSRVTLTSTYPIWSDSVTEFGLDAQGDLWTLGYASRASLLYHLTGHVPPRDGPWPVVAPDNMAASGHSTFPFQGPNCDEWPALATYTYSYRTPSECQRYLKAYTILERRGSQYGVYAVEADGSIWWLSADQLLHLSADGSVLSTRTLPVAARLAPDPQHGVWITTNDAGVLYATDAEVQPVSIGLEKNALFTPLNLAIDTQGTVWAGTNRGVQRLRADGQNWQRVETGEVNAQPGSPPFTLLATASAGGMWLANPRELWHYDGNGLTHVPQPHDSDLFTPQAIQSDQAGHVWIIGPGCNLLELNPVTRRWQRHLPDQNFDQLSVGTDDTVIALSDAGQLFARPAGTADWKIITQLDRLLDPVVVADNHGGAWVGLRRTAEVRHYQNGSAQPIVLPLPEKKYFNLFVDRQSRLWLSTSAEILRYAGSDWQTVGAPSIGLVHAFTTAPDGRLWIAGQRGIAVYDPKLDK